MAGISSKLLTGNMCKEMGSKPALPPSHKAKAAGEARTHCNGKATGKATVKSPANVSNTIKTQRTP